MNVYSVAEMCKTVVFFMYGKKTNKGSGGVAILIIFIGTRWR
jgi:hypothetical protein